MILFQDPSAITNHIQKYENLSYNLLLKKDQKKEKQITNHWLLVVFKETRRYSKCNWIVLVHFKIQTEHLCNATLVLMHSENR